MNKFGMVLGAAAIVTLAGCKDPDYKYGGESTAQDETKFAESQPAKPAEVPGVAIETASTPKCNCLPGAKHMSPCLCGDPNCKCIVEVPVIPPPPPPPVAKPVVAKARGSEYSTYIVQKGDVLSKIARKYGLKVSDIRTANPRIKKDVIWVGMRLQLPGKIDVGPQAAPAVKAPKLSVKKPYAPYTGATKLYSVKSGDTIGGIAYANGLSIRQFKELNGLKKDLLRIGQKVKIPTQKVVAAAKPAATKKAESAKRAAPVAKAGEPAAAPAAKPSQENAAAPVAAPAGDPAKASDAESAQPAESKEAAPKAAEPVSGGTYVVQEGDDMTGVSIRWGVSAAAIRALNNLSDDAQLVPGQILKLPAEAQQ